MSYTPHQVEEARRRQTLVQALPSYSSLAAAAAALGEPVANLCRYRKKYDGTLESLIPATDKAGRPPLAIVLTPEEIAFAKSRFLMTESLPLAIEALADSPVCGHRTRELLDRYRDSRDYPPSLYKALRVAAEEWEAYKGGKKATTQLFNARRGMFLIDADGHRREVVSGGINEQDDVSVDVPYYVTLPDGSFRVGRQVLASRDLRSEQWKGACAVARERDSYRAEDIVRFNRWLVGAHGMFDRFRFERGIWESDMVQGIKLPDGRRWGGITQLIPVDHCYSSNGKAIEGGFRMLHKVLGLYGVRIGKSRGEYAEPSADMIAVNEGRKHPAECGFIPWEQLLSKFEAAFQRINARAHYDRHSGEHLAPDDIWHRDMQARPGKRLPVCPPELAYHFLPVKRIVSVGAAWAGQVRVSLEGYRQPFLFRVSGFDAQGKELPFLERGHKVIACFDPHEAAAGARIFNLDDTARNRGGYRLLQELFTAPLWEDAPQVDLSGRDRGDDAGARARRSTRQQVRTAFTSIGTHGQGARRVHHAHDGEGRTARVESGAAPASRIEPVPSPSAKDSQLSARRAKPAIVEDLTLGPDDPVASAPLHAPRAPQIFPSEESRRPVVTGPAAENPRRTTVLVEDLDLR